MVRKIVTTCKWVMVLGLVGLGMLAAGCEEDEMLACGRACAEAGQVMASYHGSGIFEATACVCKDKPAADPLPDAGRDAP